jgi:hypothetical protein
MTIVNDQVEILGALPEPMFVRQALEPFSPPPREGNTEA